MIDKVFLMLAGWEIYHFKSLDDGQEGIFAQNLWLNRTVNRKGVLEMWSDFGSWGKSQTEGLQWVDINQCPQWLVDAIVSSYNY